MIPQVENIQKSENESFSVSKYSGKWFQRSWHYHAEFELLMITKGHGMRVVGTDRSAFEAGDLVLIGGNVPHAWFSDPIYYDETNDLSCESIYVQFNRDMFGTRFASSPEMQAILRLLEAAKYGLRFTASVEEIQTELFELFESNGLDRMLRLIRLLDHFQQGTYEKILDDDYFANSIIPKSVRIRLVNQYVINNYMDEIKLDEAAKLAEMNVSAFCRFFKKMTKRTFSQYVKEVRIDFAQQLLMNTELPSNIIGFECGFSSVAYFNQCFKSISGVSPLQYRKAYSSL